MRIRTNIIPNVLNGISGFFAKFFLALGAYFGCLNALNGQLDVCLLNTPVLRMEAIPVVMFHQYLTDMAKDMLQLMYASQGIGLAAPQIGKSMQLIVIDLQQKDSTETVILDGSVIPMNIIQPFYCVNPSFEPVSDVKVNGKEGCLSLPGIAGNVNRYREIILKYQDLKGVSHTLQCKHLFARCVQHECDHLRGVLFTDLTSKIEQWELY